MATRYEDEEIEQARAALRSMSDKSETLRQSGGTLNPDGRIRGDTPRESGSGADQGSQARQNMRGGKAPNGTINLNLPSSDKHITGEVGGKDKRRPAKTTWGEDKPAPQKQEAMLRPTKLNLPMVRSMRPANADGATSFHFAHEAISKANSERTSSRGTKTRKGAAHDHVSYIERDEAVARAEDIQFGKIEKELADIAKTDPELARRLGLDPDAIANDNTDKKADGKSAAEYLGVGAMAAIYIEREEALAHNDNGIAVLFTNISRDPAERREFWKLVEEHESDPSEDKLRLTISDHTEFWSKVATDRGCPAELRRAIEVADPGEEAVIRTGDNEAVRQVMSRHGWKPREDRPEGETDEQRAAREEREAATSFGARFEDGRGGRVQYRIVGELPYDVDHDARVRILRGFTEEFEKRKLPYIAVMHAPDHTNDDRNWHFHLVYHDRPTQRFTGQEKDHLWDLPEDAAKQVIDRHSVLKFALSKDQSEHIGKWDFTVPFTYMQKCRHTKTTYPFAQAKVREANSNKFVPNLRRILSDLTNRELEAAKLTRRLDPRRYEDMGIHKESEEHLGTQAARLETLGIPTEKGLRNESKQWAYVQANLEQARVASEREIDRKLKGWNNGIAAADLSGEEEEKLRRAMVRWEQAARARAAHDAIRANLQEHYERLRSRAKKVEQMAKKHLSAITLNHATRRQSANVGRYAAKQAEAEGHLMGLRVYMATEIAQIAASEMTIQKYDSAANAESGYIEAALAGGKVQRRKKEDEAAAAFAPGKKGNEVQEATATKLGHSAIDGYINGIVKSRRRLVREKGWIVPRSPDAKERDAIAASNYAATQGRLKKIKDLQDGMISELVDVLKSNPRMLRPRPNAPQKGTVIEQFSLGTHDRRLQQTFSQFHAEPEISLAVEKALQAIENSRQSARSTSAQSQEAEGKNAASRNGSEGIGANGTEFGSRGAQERENATRPPQTAGNAEKPSAAAGIDLVEIMRAKHLRPTIARTPNGLEVAFRPEDVALYRLPEKAVISDDRTISRIEGIARSHDRAVKRLVAYLDKKPSLSDADQGSEGNALSDRAPAELREIAANFNRDPQVRRAFENARIRSHLDMHDPRIKLREPANDEGPDPTSELAAKIAVGQNAEPVTDHPTLQGRGAPGRDADASRATASEGVSAHPVIPPANIPDGPANDSGAKTAGNPVQASLPIDLPTVKADAANPGDTSSQSHADQAPAASGAKQRLVPNYDEPAEAISGARSIAGTDDYGNKPSAKSDAGEKGKKENGSAGKRSRRAIANFDPTLLEAPSAGTVANRKLEKGIDPKIDRWIEAEERNDIQARRKAAALVREDRRLASLVNEMEPGVRARMQRDWEGIDDKRRTRGKGVERDEPGI